MTGVVNDSAGCNIFSKYCHCLNTQNVTKDGDAAIVEGRYPVGELGAFVMNLGDGYLIHGTKREELLGRPASHGCVRVGAADLEKLYASVPNATRVFIFE